MEEGRGRRCRVHASESLSRAKTGEAGVTSFAVLEFEPGTGGRIPHDRQYSTRHVARLSPEELTPILHTLQWYAQVTRHAAQHQADT